VDGVILNGKDNIKAYLVQHFSSLFSSSNHVLDNRHSSLLDKVVTEEENV
jgi:hypothetical protein